MGKVQPFAPCGLAGGATQEEPGPREEPLLDSMSPKERREWENSTCLGGLRNPRFSAEKLPCLRPAGQTLYGYLDEFISSKEENLVETLLSPAAADRAQGLEQEVST